jgi:hypothetical protein
MRARVHAVERGADHPDGASTSIDGTGMRCPIDAQRKAGHDDDPLRRQCSRDMPRKESSFWRRLTRAHDGYASMAQELHVSCRVQFRHVRPVRRDDHKPRHVVRRSVYTVLDGLARFSK